jgi:hypothetical protein
LRAQERGEESWEGTAADLNILLTSPARRGRKKREPKECTWPPERLAKFINLFKEHYPARPDGTRATEAEIRAAARKFNGPEVNRPGFRRDSGYWELASRAGAA